MYFFFYEKIFIGGWFSPILGKRYGWGLFHKIMEKVWEGCFYSFLSESHGDGLLYRNVQKFLT